MPTRSAIFMAPSFWRKFFWKEKADELPKADEPPKADELPTADELPNADVLLYLCMKTVKSSAQYLSTKDSSEHYLINRHQCDLLVTSLSDTLAVIQKYTPFGENSIPVLQELLHTFLDAEGLVRGSCITTSQWPRAAIEQWSMKETFSKLIYDIQWYGFLLRSSRFRFRSTFYKGQHCEQVVSALLKAMKEDEESLKQRLRFVEVVRPTEKELVIQLLRQLEASSSDVLFLSPSDLDRNGALIAHGGFGAVVKTTFLGRECAMKIINVGSNSTSVGDAFRKEMDAMKKLCHHPHIVRLFCYSRTDEACYLIMEKMQMNLSKYLHHRKNIKGRLSVLEAVSLMLQIGEGMEYIHSKGAAHRDLKPENVLVNLENPSDEFSSRICSVKIADFGLTKTKEASQTCSIHTKNTGTSMYMAPEVIELGEDYPEKVARLNPLKADIYSFGIMCSMVLTGENPYKVAFTREMKKQLKAGTLPRPELPRECPPRLATLIRRCWAEDHHERPLFPEVCRELRNIEGLKLTGIIKTDLPILVPRTRLAWISSIMGKPLVDIHQMYTLGPKLARGRYAVVRLCTHKETGAVFACKSINKYKLISSDDIENVKREVQIMHHLSGIANIVELVDVFEGQGSVHLLIEYCWGGKLSNRIVAKRHYSECAAADMVRVIVKVVHKCHSLGVLHGALGPENFLFASRDEDMPLKLMNFSSAKFFRCGGSKNSFSEYSDKISSPPDYTSQLLWRLSFGPEDEMWNVGVIFYILLCGVPPFWTDAGQVDFKANISPKISSGAKDLVTKLLNRTARERLTAQQILNHPWMMENGQASDEPLGDEVLIRLKSFSAANKMKKLALYMTAESLPEEETVGLWELFKSIDTDNSKTLTLEELKDWLIRRGTGVEESDIKKLMDAMDVDGNGEIDLYEFISATMHTSKAEKEDRLIAAFQHFDSDDSGYITSSKLQEALEAMGSGADPATIQEIMNEVDANKDGRIDYNEFVAMMRKGNPRISSQWMKSRLLAWDPYMK